MVFACKMQLCFWKKDHTLAIGFWKMDGGERGLDRQRSHEARRGESVMMMAFLVFVVLCCLMMTNFSLLKTYLFLLASLFVDDELGF